MNSSSYEFVILIRHPHIHTEIEVPDPLTRSRIWLLLKAEPNTDPNNHRPISLFSVVTKMLTACTAYLLTAYVETHNIISPEQRGFQSAKGTADHLFMVPAILEDANINRRDLRLLYVDWKQAFPSIPHDRLFQTLELLGIPNRLISMVKQLYTGQRASVLTPHGETDQFEVTLGGLQGEKLTPTLWLLFMQPLLRWLGEGNRGYCFAETIEGRRVRITLPTFADDLGVATGSNADMQAQVNKIHAFNKDWAGSLDLGLPKCALTGLCWPNSASSSPGNANALRWTSPRPGNCHRHERTPTLPEPRPPQRIAYALPHLQPYAAPCPNSNKPIPRRDNCTDPRGPSPRSAG